MNIARKKPGAAKKRKPPFKPVTAEDVTDLALLPKRFDMHAAKVLEDIRMLGDKLLPALKHIEQAIASHAARLLEVERTQREHHDRLAALEAARKDTP